MTDDAPGSTCGPTLLAAGTDDAGAHPRIRVLLKAAFTPARVVADLDLRLRGGLPATAP